MYVVFIFLPNGKVKHVFHKGNHGFQQYVSGVISWDYW